MELGTLISLLRIRSELHSHDRWTREELLAHQARALAELRAFALARSPFFREFHRGVEDRPLGELPVLTKAMLMERFDDLVTDREVRLADVERVMGTTGPTDLFRGRYRVAGTAGTTGRRGIFLADPSEWATVLASYARANDWAGIPAGLTHRLRVAVVSSRNPTHQSAIVGATLASRFIPTLRLDAAQPLAELVAALDAFRPVSLVGYASILRALAEEQLTGRLSITPQAVMSASEVLTGETRARIRSAFGTEPFNVYAATETAGIASECALHRLHLYEDLVIAEIVDEENRPVPPGVLGAKILATVLFSRTQPLIRYEISDRVEPYAEACPDGLPFALIGQNEGREEEVLRFMGRDGQRVAIHPNVFHAVLEPVPVAAWQVVQERERVKVLLAGAGDDVVDAELERAVGEALVRAGAREQSVQVERVATIPRTRLGKAPLIHGLNAPPTRSIQSIR